MNYSKIETIVADIKSNLPKGLSSSERADVFVCLGREMGMLHLLRPEAQPPNPDYLPLPKEAPELYRDRANRKETAPEFTYRVYKPWLGKGLARNHLLSLDRSLYEGIRNWVKKKPLPDWLDLPMLKELIDKQLEEMGVKEGEMLPHPSFDNGLRDQLRLYHGAKTRARKKQASKTDTGDQ